MARAENLDGTKRLPLRVKLGYGATAFSESLVWTMFVLLYLFFLTDVVHVGAASAGALMTVGVLWGAALNPAVGIWSDGLRAKRGRRRVFLLGTALPFGLISWGLYAVPDLGPNGVFWFALAMVLLFFTVFAFLDVPYTALAAETTQDFDERTSLMSFRTAFGEIAAITGASLSLILVESFSSMTESPRSGWSATAATFGFVSILPILATWRSTRGYELPSAAAPPPLTPKALFTTVWNNKPFRFTLALLWTGALALNLAGSVMVYYMTYYLGLTKNQQSLAFLFFCGCTLFWIAPVEAASRRLGKRGAYLLFIGIWVLAQGVGMLLLQPGSAALFYVLIFFASAGVIAFFIMGLSMLADVVEVEELETGQRREGLYMGFAAFCQQISTVAAVGIVGVVLDGIGYVPGAEQTPICLWGMRLLYAEGSGRSSTRSPRRESKKPCSHACGEKAIDT